MMIFNGINDNKESQKRSQKRLQKGLTLIEASMVLALSAVVIAGAVMYYNSAAESNKIQRAQGLLGGIQSGIQSVYSTRPSFAGLSSKELTMTAAIPRAFISGNGANATIVNPWGGEVLVAAATPATNYNVTFKALSLAACTAMASVDLGNSLIGLKVGKTALALGSFTGGDVADACQAGGAAERSVDIEWTFK